MATVRQLHPDPARTHALSGLYLAHDLRQLGADAKPFVYSNFVVSLDGRVSVVNPDTGRQEVPPAIANARDWRLYQELGTQADCLLIGVRHLKALAQGRQTAMLTPADDPAHADLRAWRAAAGLPRYPAVAVISRTLDVPVPDLLRDRGIPLYVFTGAGAASGPAPPGVTAIQAGPGRDVEAEELVAALSRLGHRTVYSIAGPRILHTLLAAQVLDRLYLTHAHRLLGGQGHSDLVAGPALPLPAAAQLRELYLDAAGEGHPEQLFAVYDLSYESD